MGFSNASLAYLNYPTQVIFKSAKLIPVLLGAIIIQKKKVGPLDFFAAFCMCVGLIFFTLGKLFCLFVISSEPCQHKVLKIRVISSRLPNFTDFQFVWSSNDFYSSIM